MKTKREEIAEFEELLTKATFGNYTEGKYSDVSEIVRFMQSDMKPIKAELLKQVAFIVGPSGAGKSTLMNDLAKENNLIIAENSNGELMLKARDSITAIGLGEGSTTLFPTAWSPTHLTGIFLDCAGEGDTGGVIARAINALIKSVIASNVEQAKLLFVAAQPSLSAKGSYGESFKKSLDANAQFLNDINYFKDSIAFVVSHAGLRPNTHDTVKSLIQTILEKHGNLNNYKDAVTSVLQREEERAFSRISTFSEPNNSSKTGDFYISPVWQGHPAQREKIMNMIEQLPFTKIPSKNFFKVSFDSDVQKQMKAALEIVKMKIGDLLVKAINSKANIYAVELRPFVKYLGELKSGKLVTNLKHYIKILKWNDYFKIADISREVQKIDEEMIFLSQFTKLKSDTENLKEHPVKEDWLTIAKKMSEKIGSNLDKIYDEAQVIVNSVGNNFSKFESKSTITTKSAFAHSASVSTNLSKLYDKYKEKAKTEQQKDNMNSKYFKDETSSKPCGTEKEEYQEKEAYTETETYTVQEPFTESVSYIDQEPYPKKESVTKTVPRTKIETYIEQEAYTDKEPYTEQESYTESQPYPDSEPYPSQQSYQATEVYYYEKPRTGLGGFFTAGFGTQRTRGERPITKWKDVTKYRPVTKWRNVTKQRDVTKWRDVTKYRDVTRYKQVTENEDITELIDTIDYRDVTKWRDVIKYRDVQKERDVVKERDVTKERDIVKFEDVTEKVFDEKTYNADIKKLDNDIAELRKLVDADISKCRKAEGKCSKDAIFSKDKFEKKYEDLQGKWQDAEYGAYFAENPTKTLELLGINTIAKLCGGN